MTKMLWRIAVALASALVAILAAGLLPGGFRLTLDLGGFVVAVIALALCQVLLAPLVEKLTAKYFEPLAGGVGIISTLVSLLVVSLMPGGVQLTSIQAWIVSGLVIWVVTAVTTWLAWFLINKYALDKD